jgi:phosphoserine phosphatase
LSRPWRAAFLQDEKAKNTLTITNFMFQILLIRPGMTEYDQQGRVQGTLDIPLCEDGRQEVDALVNQLRDKPITAVYSSPSKSAQQTAESLAATRDLKVKTVEKLENLDHGLWQGMLVSDVKAKQPRVYRQWQEQPETVCPPQGETLSDAKERVQGVIAKLMKKHKSEGLLALVVPEPLASVVRKVLRQDEWGDLWHCSEAAAKWELIDVPQTVGAK